MRYTNGVSPAPVDPAAVVARSRESSIVLDEEGHFWHDGARMEHPGLVAAFRRWLRRGPDGRTILEAGPGNWCYVKVEGAALRVDEVLIDAERVVLGLWDGTSEVLDPDTLRVGPGGALHCSVRGLQARFSRDAHFKLGERLELGPSGRYVLRLGQTSFEVPAPRE